jgi:hypothetical protein
VASDVIIDPSPVPEQEATQGADGDTTTIEPAPVALVAAPMFAFGPDQPYSDGDLAFFHRLTGYRLASRGTLWVVVDDEGNRAAVMDRIFTTLAEEAFRLADRSRRAIQVPPDDLTTDHLVGVLGLVQRAAATIGSRGTQAFNRLEDALSAAKNPTPVPMPAATPFDDLVELATG